MILATEKLNVVIALVEVEIEIAASLWAFQIAGKHVGSTVFFDPPRLVPLLRQ